MVISEGNMGNVNAVTVEVVRWVMQLGSMALNVLV